MSPRAMQRKSLWPSALLIVGCLTLGAVWPLAFAGLATAAPVGACDGAGVPGSRLGLPNITKTLGGSSGWDTPFIVQNTGTGLGTIDVEMTFYRFSDGALVLCKRGRGIPVGAAFAEDPNADTALPDNSQFSVIIQAYDPDPRGLPGTAVAIVNQQQGSGLAARAAAYTGIDDRFGAATSIALPNTARNYYGWDTPVIVQNLGSAAASVTASFVSFDGTKSFQTQFSISQGRSKVLDPALMDGLVDGTQYAVTLTSSAPIGAVVNVYNASGPPGSYSYVGLSQAATTGFRPAWAPFVSKTTEVGSSPLVIQNVGTVPATPRVAWIYDSGAKPVTITGPTLDPGRSWVLDPRFRPEIADNTTASASVSTVEPFSTTAFPALAGVVLPTSATTTDAYPLIASDDRTILLPNITRRLGGACGWTTVIRITAQNSGPSASAQVTFYRLSDGAAVGGYVQSFGATAAEINPEDLSFLADGGQYSATIQGVEGTPTTLIEAVVIEQQCLTGGDNYMIYSGQPRQ